MKKKSSLISLTVTLTMLLVPLTAGVGATPANSDPGLNVLPGWASVSIPGSEGTSVFANPVQASPSAEIKWEDLPPDVRAKVDPRILAELRGDVIPAHLGGGPDLAETAPHAHKPLDKTRFVVYLKAKADVEAIADQRYATRLERRTAVLSALLSTAQATQGPVKALLDARMSAGSVASYQPFFIFNGFAVEGELDTVIELAQRDDVDHIVANYPKVYYGSQTAPLSDLGGLHPDNWNIDLVDAERVWDEFGITGEGAVVAVYDSGADWDHVALIDQYRGWDGLSAEHNYDWFETDTALYPGGNLGPSVTSEPTVYGDHGTHVLGTMVGDGGTEDTRVGMAPGAQWIALSDQLNGSYGDDISTHKAFQWLLAPTDLTGQLSTANPALAPDVVNCSWGISSPADDFLEPDIAALRAAGIATVFASGNPSAGGGSIGSPGSAPSAITVGATDINDNVAGFSGRGPSFWEGVEKPDLTAPGVNIKSTLPGDNYQGGWNGTSMAAPHVSGLVALMVSADLEDGRRDLNVDELERFMKYSALDLGDPGFDVDYGYGRIDAYGGVRWVRSAGDLRGTVSDAGTSAPIPGATVTGLSLGDTFSAQTGASGEYSTTVPAGVYDVVVKAWGYHGDNFAGQTVITGALSIANFYLTRMDTALLTGQVLSGTAPVSGALVYVADAPWVTYATGASGAYTLTLPVGSHGLVVEATGYRFLSEDVSVASGGSSHDFDLTPAPTILLVEADRTSGWFFGNPVKNYIRWALDWENYLYDEWEIEDAFGTWPGYGLAGVPPTTTLRAYDVVIWAHGGGDADVVWTGIGGSPAEIGADDELIDYLDAGGNLLLSGQDIAFWDDGSGWFDSHVRADLVDHTAAVEGETASGAGFLDGLNLELTDASLKNYANGVLPFYPDSVAPQDGSAYPVLSYDNGSGGAALAVAPCDAPYRLVYVAAGLEAFAPRTGPIPEYADMVDRSIEWLGATKPEYGVSLIALPGSQTDEPGQTVSYDLQVANTGVMSSEFELSLAGNGWPTRILSGTTEVTLTLDLPACSMQELTLEVDIPSTAAAGDNDTVAITALPYPSTVSVPPGNSAQVSTMAFPQWQTEAPMPTPRYRLAATNEPDSVHYYAIGGQGGAGWGDPMSANERYNACNGQWESLAPMPTARGNVAATVIEGRIYVPGGYDGTLATPILDVLEIYDLASDTWRSGAPMPVALSGAAVAAYDGKLYTFGGSSAGGDVANTYEYDPASDNWKEKAPMPGGARGYAAAAELGGLIYVAGGWQNLNVVEVYDPAGDSWSMADSMNVGRQSAGLVATGDGYLYVSGGGNGWAGLNIAERYDPASDTWVVIPSLNDGDRAGSSSALAAGRVFAIGGSGGALSDVNESLQLSDTFCNSGKSVGQSNIGPGGRLTYTIEIHSDPVTLTGASVVDLIPDGTTWAGFGLNPIGAAYNSGANRVEWSGSVPARSDPLTFTFGVDADTTGWAIGDPITNVATFDSGTGLVFSTTAFARLYFPDPSPSAKAVDKGQALAGDVLTYTVNVENASALSDTFSLRDPIPADTTYVPGSLTATVGTAWYDAGEDAVYWTGVLPAAGGYINTSGDYEWADSNGNGPVPGVTFQWQDMTGAIDTGVNADDGVFGTFPIGFGFNFYGNDYTDFYVSPNGWVGFSSISGLAIVSCIDYGGSGTPDNFVGGFGGDRAVYSGDGGAVTYKQFGSAPHRYLVVQFTNTRYLWNSTADFLDMQIILYEGNNGILVQYQNLSTSPTTNCFGVEGTGPGYPYRFYQGICESSIEEDLSVLFLPDGAEWAGATADVTFAVTTTAVLPFNTWITNTATITGTYRSVERSVGTLVNPVDLGASTKTADRSQAAVGDVVTYDVLLDNAGLVTATGATLSDPIPTHTTYVSGSLAYGDGIGGYGSGVITWTGDIPPGGSITLTFAVTLTTPLDDLTPVTNTATLDDGGGGLYQLEEVFWARSSDLSHSFKMADPLHVAPGGAITYTVYVYNSGIADAPGEMRDELPPELTYVSGSLSCSSGSCGEASGVITWTGTAYGRSMVPVRFRAMAGSGLSQGDLITNTGTVTDDVWMAGYPAGVTVEVVESADLWVSKIAAGEVEARALLSYTIAYGNDGPYETNDTAQVVDVLPAGVTYVGSLPTGVYSPTGGTLTWDTLTWDVGALAAGISGTLVLTVRVEANTPPLTVLSNTASISLLPQDLNPANNTAEWTTLVNPASNVYGVRLTPGTASAAGVPAVPVYYTLQVDNDGDIPDTFDVSVDGNGWPTVVPATIGPVAAGGHTNLVVTVNVPPTAPIGSTDRATVTVFSRGDPFESASATLTTTAATGTHTVYLPVLMRNGL